VWLAFVWNCSEINQHWLRAANPVASLPLVRETHYQAVGFPETSVVNQLATNGLRPVFHSAQLYHRLVQDVAG
jgi:hypothetical protein